MLFLTGSKCFFIYLMTTLAYRPARSTLHTSVVQLRYMRYLIPATNIIAIPEVQLLQRDRATLNVS